MNKTNIVYILFLFISFICIIYLVFLLRKKVSKNEGFTPSIRKIYRPYLRSSRIGLTNIYTNYKNKLHNIARKFGIM
jgi:hypothetical protein